MINEKYLQVITKFIDKDNIDIQFNEDIKAIYYCYVVNDCDGFIHIWIDSNGFVDIYKSFWDSVYQRWYNTEKHFR